MLLHDWKEEYRNMKTKTNKLWRFIYFPVAFIFMEEIFHIAIYKNAFANMLYPLLFSATFGIFVAIITCVGNRVVNAILSYFIVAVTAIYYDVQIVYYDIFKTFLSLVSIGGAKDAMNFKVVMFESIMNCIGWLVIMLVPLLSLVLLQIFVIDFKRPGLKQIIINAVLLLVCPIVVLLSLNIAGKGINSAYDLFYGKFVLELSMNKLGVVVTTVKDAVEMTGITKEDKSFDLAVTEAFNNENDNIIATESDVNAAETDVEEIVYDSQIDESVDFQKLYDETDDKELKNLTAYFSNRKPTSKNEYTGMFKDYNLVFVTAESLSKYGISDKCTPTLYKIMNEGFVFDNFYNPRWYHSTIDGEYVNCLGQYPSSSEWSFYKSAETYQPYALGNALNSLGYKSYAYHDFNFYYYNRSETHANMGYDFKAIDYGLEIPYNATYSDLDTMEAVYEEFINEEHFNMYFMSFSGHLPYDYQYQAMCLKNKDEATKLTEGLNLPESAVAYIAAQMELDKALEFLIQKLEEAGRLDETVFVVTPDHYPYGLNSDAYDTLAGKAVSDDAFELHKACLGIWNSKMEEPIVVDELCSSVDVLPTVLNLFGIKYDSRVLAGNDILDMSKDSPDNLVIFADHSFITDKIKYNASNGQITYLVDEYKVSKDYVDTVTKRIEDIIYISDKMIDKDYFSFMLNSDK